MIAEEPVAEPVVVAEEPVADPIQPVVNKELEVRRSLRKFNKETGAQVYCVQPDVPYYVFASDVPT